MALVSAPLLWSLAFMTAMASQVSFFSMDDYLEQPMWTSQVSPVLAPFLTLASVSGALVTPGCWILALIGIVLIATSFQEAKLLRAACLICTVLVAQMVVYEALVTTAYFSVRHRFPSNFNETSGPIVVAILIMCGLTVLMWRLARAARSKNVASAA